ncbi:sigma-70 family RNA polymerase sigma factor [Nocardioides sp. WS12]|uniref:RNA polymerase sigma factor n=1 Tax=Nocardioides sp. WS12 TaxID=2486272 RepID=UPI00191EA8EB|nr:sigma-70 family RNA polymerase sigma factor [Nocardioides sp. WS12]
MTLDDRPGRLLNDEQVPLVGSDADLMDLFYREHNEDMKRFFARRTADPHEIADLTADLFVAVIKHAHRYRPEAGRPIAWLYGIARNLVADSSRRRARRFRAESKIQGRRLLDETSALQILERVESERAARDLYTALDVLSPKDRRLMELVAVDGCSVVEAAAVLEMKPGNARVRLHRSRARLQRELDNPFLLDDEPTANSSRATEA